MQAFDLGLPNLMIQRIAMAYGKGDYPSVGAWFGTGTAVLAGVAALIATAGIGVSLPLPGFFGLAGVEADLLRHCFQLASVAAAANLFNNAFVGFSRAVQNTAFMNCAGVVATMASLAVSCWVVLAGFGLWALAAWNDDACKPCSLRWAAALYLSCANMAMWDGIIRLVNGLPANSLP